MASKLDIDVAIRNGDLNKIKEIYPKGEKIDQCYLLKAAEHQQNDIIKYIFENSQMDKIDMISTSKYPLQANINGTYYEMPQSSKDNLTEEQIPKKEYSANDKHTLFSIACIAIRKGNILLLKYIMETYPTGIKYINYLEYAIECNHIDIVKYLIEQQNYDVNDWHCLRLAVDSNRIEIVKYLVDKKANIDEHYGSPLNIAIINEYNEIADYLISKGADIRIANDQPLRYAALVNNMKIVKQCIEKGADIHVFNDEALKNAYKNSHKDMIKYLIEKGADPKSLLNDSFYKESRPLMYKYVKELCK